MIRILHIVHALTKGGGLSNFIMNYYNRIDRSKIQFDFVYFIETESNFKEEINLLGGHYYKWNEPDLRLRYKKAVRAFFEEHKGEYSAVHCHALFAVAAYADIAKEYGIKVIAHAHSVGYGQNGLLRKIRNFYFVKMCKYRSDFKLACSVDAAVFMFGEKDYKTGKVLIIRNAVDCEKFYFKQETRDAVRSELGLKDSYAIGHVGGFSRPKNHEYLIQLFNQFLNDYPNAILLLVGGEGLVSGSTMNETKRMVHTLGIEDKVIFTGIRSDVNRLMMAMDLFVFPSTFEGFGLVLVEAQASGLKCIASDKVPKESKCTENILFIPLDDENRWVNEMKMAEEENKDRSVNKKNFDKYNIVFNTERIESFYQELS